MVDGPDVVHFEVLRSSAHTACIPISCKYLIPNILWEFIPAENRVTIHLKVPLPRALWIGIRPIIGASVNKLDFRPPTARLRPVRRRCYRDAPRERVDDATVASVDRAFLVQLLA
jgi:hypothetical protein